MEQIQTTRNELKLPVNTPLVHCSDTESFNVTSLETNSKVNSPVENSKLISHWGSGYNSEKSDASMSSRVFVLSYLDKPLTPCKSSKARKLLIGGVAKVVWNKFGLFGIKMLVATREEKPKTVLGVDFGTKFEGYSVVCAKENVLNVMWKLPDKKNIVRKLIKRTQLRRARRWRNCRRREARFNNRNKDGFIVPSQLMMIQSRLKVIKELFRYYPISFVALEDVKFNHKAKRYGKNFSTIEVGKKMIYNFIRQFAELILFEGRETKQIREDFGLKKSSNKSAENFNSHCVDSFVIANKLLGSAVEPNFNIKVVDDTYRCVRRRLHDTEFSKGGIRYKYSTGNFKGIRKGTICEYGQIVGGTRKSYWIRNSDNKRIGRVNISWLSHNLKTKNGGWLSSPM